MDAGENLWRMRQNPVEQQLIATGGKENDLKIWDLENPNAPLFMAKNVRHILFLFSLGTPCNQYVFLYS